MAVGITKTLDNFVANTYQQFDCNSSLTNIFICNKVGNIVTVEIQISTAPVVTSLAKGLKIYPGTTQVVLENTQFKFTKGKAQIKCDTADGIGVVYTAS